LDFHRKNNTRKFNTGALVNNYLNSEKLSFNNDAQDFYTLLQFYSYLRIKEFKILDSIILNVFNDHRIFYKIEFHLQDFLRFIEQESYYQLKNKQQILDSFFKNLSDAKLKTFMSSYQEEQFKSLAVFPGYGITKKDKYITVQLYIAKDFYHYDYPFHFNQFFITYRNKYECIVKLRIIQSFSQHFFVIYRQSDKKGFRKWWISFRMAAFIAAILAGLIPNPVEASETYIPSNSSSISIERVVDTLRGGFKPDPNQVKRIVYRIKEDSGLVRLAQEACKNQRVQDNINHLQDELAKGNDNPGIHKKYLGNNVWEHRARGGGRLYTREIGDKVEILGKSGKKPQNQRKVIKRVKELYVNKKN
jgi:hypothetical protein